MTTPAGPVSQCTSCQDTLSLLWLEGHTVTPSYTLIQPPTLPRHQHCKQLGMAQSSAGHHS